jgi:hypothetical protein
MNGVIRSTASYERDAECKSANAAGVRQWPGVAVRLLNTATLAAL